MIPETALVWLALHDHEKAERETAEAGHEEAAAFHHDCIKTLKERAAKVARRAQR